MAGSYEDLFSVSVGISPERPVLSTARIQPDIQFFENRP